MFFLAWYQHSNTLIIEASHLRFQPILYAGLQVIVSKCCPPMTVSYKKRDVNHREPSLGRWWQVIKHFLSKALQEPLCCSCSIQLSIVLKKNNTWGQHSSSLVLNKEIKLQHTLHIWRETSLFRHIYGLTMCSELTSVMCRVDGHTRDIAQSFIWFSLWF